MSYEAGMHALDDTGRLLELLREAGDHAVTLDELEVAGVHDAAGALLALEASGHTVARVFDERVPCVKLAPFDGAALVVEDPRPALASIAPESSAAPARPLLVAAALLIVALLFATRG